MGFTAFSPSYQDRVELVAQGPKDGLPFQENLDDEGRDRAPAEVRFD